MAIEYLPTSQIEATVDFAAIMAPGLSPYARSRLIASAGELALLDEPPPVRVWSDADDTPDGVGGISVLTRHRYAVQVRALNAYPLRRYGLLCAAYARERYEDLRPDIAKLEADIAAGVAVPHGAGGCNMLYPMETDEGRLAVRVPHDALINPTDEEIEWTRKYGGMEHRKIVVTTLAATAMALGTDVPGLEQLVAYSTKDRRLITRFVEGAAGNRLTAGDIAAIKPEHMVRYFDTLTAMRHPGRRLRCDPHHGNLIWHPENGFTIVDYQHDDPWLPTIAKDIRALTVALICEPGDQHSLLKESADKAAAARPLLDIIAGEAERRYGIKPVRTLPDIRWELALEIVRKMGYTAPPRVTAAPAAAGNPS